MTDAPVTQQWVGAVATLIGSLIALFGVLRTNSLAKRRREARKLDVETLKLFSEIEKNSGGLTENQVKLQEQIDKQLEEHLQGDAVVEVVTLREQILGISVWLVLGLGFVLGWPWVSSVFSGARFIFDAMTGG